MADDPFIQAGADSKTHNQVLATNVAANLSEALGAPVAAGEVTPPVQQQVVVGDPEKVSDQGEDMLDIEDILLGMKGRPRTEPSQNFLKRLLGRLKKKNPSGQIEVVNQ